MYTKETVNLNTRSKPSSKSSDRLLISDANFKDKFLFNGLFQFHKAS